MAETIHRTVREGRHGVLPDKVFGVTSARLWFVGLGSIFGAFRRNYSRRIALVRVPETHVCGTERTQAERCRFRKKSGHQSGRFLGQLSVWKPACYEIGEIARDRKP